MKRWVVAAAFTTLLARGAGNAQAQAGQVAAHDATSLSWSRLAGAEGCPALRQVASRVDAHLGRGGLVAPSEARAFLDASIEPTVPSGFRVRITLSDDRDTVMGVRELAEETTDCNHVVDAAALAIALMIDPNAGARLVDAARTPAPSLPVSPSVETFAAPRNVPTVHDELEDTPARNSPARGHWRSRVSLGALSSVGQLPGVAWGVLGGVRLSPESRKAGIEVLGLYLGRQSAELRSDAGGRFTAAAAGLAGWWAPLRSDALSLSVGAGMHAGGIAGSGFGFTARNNYAQSWLLNAILDLDLGWTARPPWGLAARASLGVPLWRDEFEATENGVPQSLFKPAPLVAFLTLSITVEP